MIEHRVRRKGARGQFHFASEARGLIPARREYVVAASHKGLHMLAAEEQSLRAPLDALRAAYGSDLVIRPHAAGTPVMEVRIGLEQRYLPEVRQALRRRGANPSEEYAGVHYCVLRFEAAPGELLGLPIELAELTSSRFSHQIVLTGYR